MKNLENKLMFIIKESNLINLFNFTIENIHIKMVVFLSLEFIMMEKCLEMYIMS